MSQGNFTVELSLNSYQIKIRKSCFDRFYYSQTASYWKKKSKKGLQWMRITNTIYKNAFYRIEYCHFFDDILFLLDMEHE